MENEPMKTFVTSTFLTFVLASTSVFAAVPTEATGTRPTADGEATEVAIATYLIDVSRIDGADQSFTADLFILLSWKDPRLEGIFETTQRAPLESVWSPGLQILNRRDLKTTFPDQAEIAPDGTITTRQRYFGTFSSPLELRDFPLDRQRFSIRLVVPGYGPDEIRLVPPPADVREGNRSQVFSVPDWDIGDINTQPEPYAVAGGAREISGYEVVFEGHRHIGFWAGKAFISIGIIIAMSWAVFWIDPKYIAPRLSVAVTSMLTLIAYRFLLDGVLPRLSYLTRMDYFLIGSTLLVLLTVIQVVVTTALEDKDHGRRAARINRHSRWVFPASLLVLMALSFLRF
jgi:hypothetical protein